MRRSMLILLGAILLTGCSSGAKAAIPSTTVTTPSPTTTTVAPTTTTVTVICAEGSFVADEAACSAHGGVAAVFHYQP